MIEKYEVKEFTRNTWEDFDALFGKHKGVSGGCWCTFNLTTSTQFNKMTRDERKEMQHQLTEDDQSCGLMIYDACVPIGWCQYGPAENFIRFARMRAYQALEIPLELKPQWRISCIFVDKHRRREGLSQLPLQAALEAIKQKGGGIVEAFPFDIPGAKRPSYTGSVKMYTVEGFEEVARLGKITVLMRKRI
jgi:GNAT superfamily N-acetyltransferase